MSIKELKNPKTDSYLKLKDYVLSNEFSWYWNNKSTRLWENTDEYVNMPFLSHIFVKRPEETFRKIPEQSSSISFHAAEVLLEILAHNNIDIDFFLRINANCVFPFKKVISSFPHVDHHYPHKNLLVYLTDAGGKVLVKKNGVKSKFVSYDPKEDSVISFDGVEHYMQTPEQTSPYVRRVCLVATFI